ncbi:MAG: exodeoxyribonuclease VII small subunit [Chloroflexota bacterium]
MAKEKPVADLTYEEAYAELEAIVAQLESEQQPLERSLQLFERGQSLASRCAELLDQAELKLRKLSGDQITDLDEE